MLHVPNWIATSTGLWLFGKRGRFKKEQFCEQASDMTGRRHFGNVVGCAKAVEFTVMGNSESGNDAG